MFFVVLLITMLGMVLTILWATFPVTILERIQPTWLAVLLSLVVIALPVAAVITASLDR